LSPIATAAIFCGREIGFRLETTPLPSPGPEEILVAIEGCTLCGSDLHTLQGRRAEPTPTILGHEMCGRIVASGTRADLFDARGARLSVGDRITWSLIACCQRCFYCQAGLPQKCEQLRKYGHTRWSSGREWHGGLAEFCLLFPGTTLVKLPDQLPLGLACPVNCATATVMAALEAAQLAATEKLLILGGGMLGLTAAAIAHHQFRGEVMLCDARPDRLEVARQMGVQRTVLSQDLTQACQAWTHYGPDVVLDTAGSTKAVEMAIHHARLGGRILLVGSVFPDVPLSLSPESIVRRCLSLRGIHNYQPRHLVAAVEAVSQPALQGLETLVAGWYPLDSIEEAVELACRADGPVRVGIRMDSPR
jgi:putative phosphonate catabolism associated alcohol dehydrogenase